MPNPLFDQCIKLFKEKLDLPNHDACRGCNPKFKHPLLPWHIGSKYEQQTQRIVFVGKTHRGDLDWDPERDEPFLDRTNRAEEYFFNKPLWAYWCRTREIVERVFGDTDEGWQKIALMNSVKCSNTSRTDKTKRSIASSCLSKAMVLGHEIEILKPTTVIFYTWSMHSDLFENPFLPSSKVKCIAKHSTRKHKVKCGKTGLGWWHRTFKTTWCANVEVLVTGHPGRKNKTDYINHLSNWIIDPSNARS